MRYDTKCYQRRKAIVAQQLNRKWRRQTKLKFKVPKIVTCIAKSALIRTYEWLKPIVSYSMICDLHCFARSTDTSEITRFGLTS